MTITPQHSQYDILIVDNAPPMLDLLYDLLKDEGYHVASAASGESAVAALGLHYYDLVITDLEMGLTNGIEVLKKAKSINPHTRVIILTGNSDVRYAIEAIRHEVDDYLLKPFVLDELLERVSCCLEKGSTKPDNNRSAA